MTESVPLGVLFSKSSCFKRIFYVCPLSFEAIIIRLLKIKKKNHKILTSKDDFFFLEMAEKSLSVTGTFE